MTLKKLLIGALLNKRPPPDLKILISQKSCLRISEFRHDTDLKFVYIDLYSPILYYHHELHGFYTKTQNFWGGKLFFLFFILRCEKCVFVF